MSKLRLGILGTGNIAGQFAAGAKSALKSEVVAVGSRTVQSAETFAGSFGIARPHGSYDALLADPAVDAIYLSLPNSMHHAWAIRAMRAGKHVLCEKPIAVDHTEAAEMFDVAAACGVMLVEAFMYRCHPLTPAVKAAVDAGTIGQLKMIRTSFCYRTTKIAGNVRFDPVLAGGSLMDVGCYCVNFSRYFAGGEPTTVNGVSHHHPTGVDDLFAGTLGFDNGIVATFTAGMSAPGRQHRRTSGHRRLPRNPDPVEAPDRPGDLRDRPRYPAENGRPGVGRLQTAGGGHGAGGGRSVRHRSGRFRRCRRGGKAVDQPVGYAG